MLSRSWTSDYKPYTSDVGYYIFYKSLNNGGHHFHQYQQNEQSPLILTELAEQKKDHSILRCKSRSWLGFSSLNKCGSPHIAESDDKYQ